MLLLKFDAETEMVMTSSGEVIVVGEIESMLSAAYVFSGLMKTPRMTIVRRVRSLKVSLIFPDINHIVCLSYFVSKGVFKDSKKLKTASHWSKLKSVGLE